MQSSTLVSVSDSGRIVYPASAIAQRGAPAGVIQIEGFLQSFRRVAEVPRVSLRMRVKNSSDNAQRAPKTA
jgi:hypothetical protein